MVLKWLPRDASGLQGGSQSYSRKHQTAPPPPGQLWHHSEGLGVQDVVQQGWDGPHLASLALGWCWECALWGGFPAPCKGRPHWAGLSAQTAWLVPTPALPLGAENLGRQRLPTLLPPVKTLGTEPLTCKCSRNISLVRSLITGEPVPPLCTTHRERLQSEASRGQGAWGESRSLESFLIKMTKGGVCTLRFRLKCNDLCILSVAKRLFY